MLRHFDDVNGEIIGEMMLPYAIISPSGRKQKTFWAKDDNTAISMFHEWKADRLKECSGREEIMGMIYGKGTWEVRQYDA